ncbi:unnamed protein product, partial [Laminaria digitata]
MIVRRRLVPTQKTTGKKHTNAYNLMSDTSDEESPGGCGGGEHPTLKEELGNEVATSLQCLSGSAGMPPAAGPPAAVLAGVLSRESTTTKKKAQQWKTIFLGKLLADSSEDEESQESKGEGDGGGQPSSLTEEFGDELG